MGDHIPEPERRKPQSAIFAALCFAALTLSGCMVGPNYRRPSVPTPQVYQEPVAAQKEAAVALPEAWWEVFQDPALNDLESRAEQANRDIGIAVTRIEQSDAARRSVRANLYPTIAAQPSFGRTRESQQRPNNGNTNGQAATYNDLQVPLTMSYELDFWGRIRRMVQSTTATEQASKEDLRFVKLTVAASVATDYYMLRETDAEVVIIEQTEKELQRGYDITNDQFRHGVISELAVKQAQTLLEQTRAQLEGLHMQRDQLEHALAILVGRTPEGFHINPNTTPATVPHIPVGLPADLLSRRPDVAVAERSAAASSAQIGVAQAAYYPQFSLTGFAGYESTNPANLVNWQNGIASLLGSITAPIFEGGRLRANVDQAKAVYRQSVLQYEKTVLVAYGDVEDQLAAIHYLARQSEAETSAVADAKRAEEIALEQYQAGLVGYLDVVVAQQTLLTNERTATQVNGAQAVSTVALIRALGGGWPTSVADGRRDVAGSPPGAIDRPKG
jgi:multidrug efflux system outer membrane protein